MGDEIPFLSGANNRSFRVLKTWECVSPMIVWQVQAMGDRDAPRTHLIADLRQASFGVRLSPNRPDDLNPSGAVVVQLRKNAATPQLGRLLRDKATGNLWLPLFKGQEATPSLWVQLARDVAPPEFRLLTVEGTALVRRSAQGSYTKRRPGLADPPAWPLRAESGLDDVTPMEGKSTSTLATPARLESPMPDFQREARDRLARRAKTVRKSLHRQAGEHSDKDKVDRLERQAKALAGSLHAVRASDVEIATTDEEGPLTISLDPELSPGQNLDSLWTAAKRARRAVVAAADQYAKTKSGLSSLEADLETIRQTPLSQREVEDILHRHGLGLGKQESKSHGPSPTVRTLPYREIAISGGDADTKPIVLRVGKSAADSDAMVKAAKANDWWLHVVGTTGSHVLIPASPLRGHPEPALLRAGAILALHFSKLRESLRGEVYVTQKRHLRKRKGDPPGLWQIDKAETMFVHYSDDELRRLLGMSL